MHRGQDISGAFRGEGAVSHMHSKGAQALLERYYVGVLEGASDAAPEGVLPADLVDESKPLLPQVGRWGWWWVVDESKPLLPQVGRGRGVDVGWVGSWCGWKRASRCGHRWAGGWGG